MQTIVHAINSRLAPWNLRAMLAKPVNWKLLLFLAIIMAMEIGDVWTTNIAIDRGIIVKGVGEDNPVMAMIQESLGSWWFLPKLAAVVLIMPAIAQSWWGVWIVFAICLAILINNLTVLLS